MQYSIRTVRILQATLIKQSNEFNRILKILQVIL